MEVLIERMGWDSEFFEINIWSGDVKDLHLNEFLRLKEFCIRKEIRLVYLFPKDESSVQFLINKSIPLVDQKVIFSKSNFNPQSFLHTNVHQYIALEQYSIMCELSLSSGLYSRFNIDKQFKRDDFERLYLKWIERSIKKEIADEVLVWKDTNNVIKGFITYKIDRSTLIIGLISVAKDIQGAGVGSSLLNAIEMIAIEEKVDEITVATQLENSTAYNFYQKNNFKVKSIQPIFHLWIQQ